jgi:hypothetical protein
MGDICSTNAEIINAYKILVGKRQGNEVHGRLRHKWEDDMKMNLRGTGCKERGWSEIN